MTQFVQALLALALMLAAIAPTLVQGGRLIAAFMAGQGIARQLLHTALALLALLLAAAAAASLAQVGQPVWAGLVLLALPWGTQLALQGYARGRADGLRLRDNLPCAPLKD